MPRSIRDCHTRYAPTPCSLSRKHVSGVHGQSVEQEAGHCKLNQCLARLDSPLILLGQLPFGPPRRAITILEPLHQQALALLGASWRVFLPHRLRTRLPAGDEAQDASHPASPPAS